MALAATVPALGLPNRKSDAILQPAADPRMLGVPTLGESGSSYAKHQSPARPKVRNEFSKLAIFCSRIIRFRSLESEMLIAICDFFEANDPQFGKPHRWQHPSLQWKTRCVLLAGCVR